MIDAFEKTFKAAKLASNGREIACLCPLCSPHKKNNRLTLYFSVDAPVFLCFRCGVKGNLENLESVLHVKKDLIENFYAAIDKALIHLPKRKSTTKNLLNFDEIPFDENALKFKIVNHIVKERNVSIITLKILYDKKLFKIKNENEVVFLDKIGNVQVYSPFSKTRYMTQSRGKLPLFFFETTNKHKTLCLFEGIFDFLAHFNEIKVGGAVTLGKNRLPDPDLLLAREIETLIFCFDNDLAPKEIFSLYNKYSEVCKVGFLPPPKEFKDWGEANVKLDINEAFFPKHALDLLRYLLTKNETDLELI